MEGKGGAYTDKEDYEDYGQQGFGDVVQIVAVCTEPVEEHHMEVRNTPYSEDSCEMRHHYFECFRKPSQSKGDKEENI